MISSGYNPKAECLHVEHLRKHHCHVPPYVWNLTAETVCAVCLMKNHSLFVQAAIIESAKKPPAEVTPFAKPRTCTVCRLTQLDRAYWEFGERVCAECRHERPKRLLKKLEQQCG